MADTVVIDGASASELRELFELADVHGDGYLSLDELRRLILATSVHVHEEALKQVFLQACQGSGTVNFEAFVDIISNLSQGTPLSTFARELAVGFRRRVEQFHRRTQMFTHPELPNRMLGAKPGPAQIARENQALQQRVDLLTKALDSAKSELGGTDDEVAKLRQQVRNLTVEKEAAVADNDVLRQRIAELESAYAALKAEAGDAAGARAMKATLNSLEQLLIRKEATIASLRAEIDANSAMVDSLQSQRGESWKVSSKSVLSAKAADARVERLRRELASRDGELRLLRGQLTETQKSLKATKAQIEALEKAASTTINAQRRQLSRCVCGAAEPQEGDADLTAGTSASPHRYRRRRVVLRSGEEGDEGGDGNGEGGGEREGGQQPDTLSPFEKAFGGAGAGAFGGGGGGAGFGMRGTPYGAVASPSPRVGLTPSKDGGPSRQLLLAAQKECDMLRAALDAEVEAREAAEAKVADAQAAADAAVEEVERLKGAANDAEAKAEGLQAQHGVVESEAEQLRKDLAILRREMLNVDVHKAASAEAERAATVEASLRAATLEASAAKESAKRYERDAKEAAEQLRKAETELERCKKMSAIDQRNFGIFKDEAERAAQQHAAVRRAFELLQARVKADAAEATAVRHGDDGSHDGGEEGRGGGEGGGGEEKGKGVERHASEDEANRHTPDETDEMNVVGGSIIATPSPHACTASAPPADVATHCAHCCPATATSREAPSVHSSVVFGRPALQRLRGGGSPARPHQNTEGGAHSSAAQHAAVSPSLVPSGAAGAMLSASSAFTYPTPTSHYPHQPYSYPTHPPSFGASAQDTLTPAAASQVSFHVCPHTAPSPPPSPPYPLPQAQLPHPLPSTTSHPTAAGENPRPPTSPPRRALSESAYTRLHTPSPPGSPSRGSGAYDHATLLVAVSPSSAGRSPAEAGWERAWRRSRSVIDTTPPAGAQTLFIPRTFSQRGGQLRRRVSRLSHTTASSDEGEGWEEEEYDEEVEEEDDEGDVGTGRDVHRNLNEGRWSYEDADNDVSRHRLGRSARPYHPPHSPPRTATWPRQSTTSGFTHAAAQTPVPSTAGRVGEIPSSLRRPRTPPYFATVVPPFDVSANTLSAPSAHSAAPPAFDPSRPPAASPSVAHSHSHAPPLEQHGADASYPHSHALLPSRSDTARVALLTASLADSKGELRTPSVGVRGRRIVAESSGGDAAAAATTETPQARTHRSVSFSDREGERGGDKSARVEARQRARAGQGLQGGAVMPDGVDGEEVPTTQQPSAVSSSVRPRRAERPRAQWWKNPVPPMATPPPAQVASARSKFNVRLRGGGDFVV